MNMQKRLKQEAKALALTFIPRDGNNHMRKVCGLTMLAFWIAWTALITTHHAWLEGAHTVGAYTATTAFVFLMLGKLWDIEYNRIT